MPSDGVYAPVRPNRIGDQLPYFEFETDQTSAFRNIHVLDDGSFAVAWKCKVPASYSYDAGHSQTINELRTLLESAIIGYEFQVIITSHNNLTNRMEEYLSAETHNERAKILRHSRAEKLLESGFNGYRTSEGGVSMLRDTYMVVTMRSNRPKEFLGIMEGLTEIFYQLIGLLLGAVGVDPAKIFGNMMINMIKTQQSEFQESLISAESTLGGMFHIQRMSREALKEHYWTAYAPSYKDPAQKVKVDKYLKFNDQIFPLPIEQDNQIIKVGNDYHGLVMMAMMPDEIGPDFLGVVRRSLPTQYTFFCNISTVNQQMEKFKLSMDSALRERVTSAFSKEEAQIFAQEVSQVKTRMFEGRRIMYCMVGIIVHGYSRQQVEERMWRISTAFKKKSVVPDIENSMTMQGISYSFPAVWQNKFTKPFARTRRVLSDDLCDLLPIHGHWGGHDNPQSVYVNRDGEVTFFDHTSADFVNWHYAITGTSGSGKSFAVVDLTLQLFAAGVKKQYLMTIKDDYDRFAKTMGRLIVIDLDNGESCINPFAGKRDGKNDKVLMQQWTTSLELMLVKGTDKELNRDETRLIEQVLDYAYDLVPEGDVLRPSWIREAFRKYPYGTADQRKMGMQNAEEVGSYCAEGIYGKLFDGHPAINEKDELVVFNLQNVLSEKISDVIINAIFTMLDNVMYMGNRGDKKHLLIDEMISMISSKGGEAVASQIKRAFRTYRSLNCMCGIASQNEEDLTTDVGQAIIGNITKRLIMMPRREMIPTLMESLHLHSDRHEANIASLQTRPGFFSEFYLVSPHGEVVCRLITDKLTYALATTTPDDVAEINRFREEMNDDWWKATVKFSQVYPYGVRAAKKTAKKRA